MLDLVVGVTAALLVAVGLVIIAGPRLPGRLRALVALLRQLVERLFQAPPAPVATTTRDLHPTTLKAVTAASELADLLRDQREENLAGELRSAIRRLAGDEEQGLLALHLAARRLRGIRLPEAAA